MNCFKDCLQDFYARSEKIAIYRYEMKHTYTFKNNNNNKNNKQSQIVTTTLNKFLAREYLGLCLATPIFWTFDSRAEAVQGKSWFTA